MLIAHAQLPTFVAVAELLNISSAARKLGITQTGATLEHRKRPTFCVSENITLIRLLELGLGFGVLPKEIAEPLIGDGKLAALNQGRTYKIPFALAWYPRKEMPDYFREIVRLVK